MNLRTPSLLAALLLLFTSCGRGDPSAEGPRLEPGQPPELQGARLLFERPDGIHLLELGKGPARLLVPGGVWPRFSPDGRHAALLRKGNVCRVELATGKVEELVEDRNATAVAFSPDGAEIWFAAGRAVKAVRIADRRLREVVTDGTFRELDIGPDAQSLVATVKHRANEIRWFNLKSGEVKALGRGCSASFSPDGKVVTNNLHGHRQLALIRVNDGKTADHLPAPGKGKTDNQFWSNHPEWVASREETFGGILFHRVSDHKIWRITEGKEDDRPDLWIP